MISLSLPARRRARKGFASSFAMAAALACGTMVASVGLETPAFAAKKDKKPEYSDAFVEVYSPASELVNSSDDPAVLAPVRGMLTAIVAATSTDDDREAAGTLMLIAGNKLGDQALQRQGLEMRIASGKVPAEQVGQFNYFIGSLAYNANDFEASRAALMASLAAGYDGDGAEGIIAETYFKQDRFAEGLSFLKGQIDQMSAAGTPVPLEWIQRGLAVAYGEGMVAQANEWSVMLVDIHPTTRNWTTSLQVVREMNEYPKAANLDLLRLMLETKSFDNSYDYFEYIEAADERIMANEVLKVLDAGLASGKLDPTSPAVIDVRKTAEARAPIDRRETPTFVAEARSAARGIEAQSVGDTFLSYDAAAEAEDMYNVAMSKGDLDANMLLTRIGIAQVKQGKLAQAQQSFAQVEGVRAPIAGLWQAYIKTLMPAAAPAAAVEEVASAD